MKEHIKESPVWISPPSDLEWCKKIVKEFNIHPVTAQVLLSKGFKTVEEIHSFLYAKLPNLIPPDQMLDMGKAIDRIVQALNNNENILIYGDNDVDGITATALLVEFLRLLNANTFFYIPQRITTNSSTISDAIPYALSNKCTLLITVDCGTTAFQAIQDVINQNIDVIVSDHHEPSDKIPTCTAILNPKLTNNNYPNRDLTGVGVAFKLAHGITNHLVSTNIIPSSRIDLKQFLDLVALGTVSDMGSLKGENRILVQYGLKQFATSKRIGLIKLLEICNLSPSTITTTEIASKVAPRLNSLGRISDSSKGVDLMLTHDLSLGSQLAQALDDNNTQRQQIEKTDAKDIYNYLEENPHALNDNALILDSQTWHPGIIPILAAKLSKQYNRPTIIITIENGIGKGSARTIPEFPLISPLKNLKHLLIDFGGHSFAAGLTIKSENIKAFKQQFINQANKTLKHDDLIPKLHTDAHIEFKDLTFEFLDSLQLLEPYGTDNPPPILYSTVSQAWAPKIVGKTHLKLYLEQNGRILEGIGFGLSSARSQLTKKGLRLQIAFTPHINVFLKKSSIQLLIKDFKICND